ncbi:MAG: MFS transporter [Clostridia bacterium]|nr:MFS transporter [Clostridia bacterium]
MEITEEKQKRNIYLYPIYKMLSWDLLFYYSIIFLFLTQVKGISAADVLLGEALYPAFKVIFLVPLTALSNKIGKRNSMIFGNFVNIFSILCYMIAQNFTYVVIGQFLSAIAFSIKSITESNFLYDTLPKGEKRGHTFAKIDGKGTSWYYYLDAISSFISGFLYIINGYLPMLLCLVSCIVSTILCFLFQETTKMEEDTISVRKYMKDLKFSFQYIFQSNRLRYLIVFGAILSGFMGILISLRSATLEQIQFPEQYFGIVFAVLGIISGISSRNQHHLHNYFHNKTLAVLALPTTISCIVIGLTVLGKLSYQLTVSIILWMFFFQFLAKGPFNTLIKRYLNNFTNTALREKIASCYNLVESISKAIIGFLVSWLLRGTTASNTMLVIGCIFTIVVVLLLDKMRSRVGLKPEEYSKKEIEFTELK